MRIDSSLWRAGAAALAGLALAVAGPGLRAAGSKDRAESDRRSVHVHVDNDEDEESGAFLGVTTEEDDSDDGGARVTMVVRESAAKRAGLQQDDVIVRFDGKAIHGPAGLSRAIHATEPGADVEIQVVRDGSRRTLHAEMGERPKPKKMWAWSGDGFRNFVPDMFDFGRKPLLGVNLTDATPELREHLGGPRDRGVLVSRVVDDSAAERAGIHVGDLIVDVDGERIDGSGDLIEAIHSRAGETFTLRVVRDGRSVELQVTLPNPRRDDDDDDRPRA
ncbi:MAG TPA: PDZ domain-containing protein [Candidatus Polarisedimenticolaceae bacterium]|nr:PDZ domain-containing protein [Candidatus Polarisedimenticolaceae bacterium]